MSPLFSASFLLKTVSLLLLLGVQSAHASDCALSYRRFWARQTYARQIRLLQSLYSNQSLTEIELRIAHSKDPFKFMRTFVPVFRDMLERSALHRRRFGLFQDFKGMLSGDPHLENFNVMLDGRGKAAVLLPDIDDMSEGPLYLDLLRLVTSVQMWRGKVPMNRMKEAYVAGLGGERHEFSDTTRALLKKSEKAGFEPRGVDLSEGLDEAELIRRGPFEEVSRALRGDLEASVQQLHGAQARLVDAYEHIREFGGSAYYRRFELLVRLKPGDSMLVALEYKEQPGLSLDQVQRHIEAAFGVGRDPLMRPVRLRDQTYFVRPRWESKLNFDLESLENSELKQVLEDQAHVLGLHHRRWTRPEVLKKYRKAVSESPRELWENEADALEEEFAALFEVLK